ncbi:MAG: 2-oxo-4-hydroxy-4-carboxy-5-ureidoimidazoline decarboxylase [Chloroflexota bacterium]|nr:2-oxo-4-hydroxy-4-carboxy-5-ureidoimidazoline decarboxylase [Chloroflexota bacterium]
MVSPDAGQDAAIDGRMAIAEVNDLDRESFISRFGRVYEDSPWIAAAAWPERPFASRDDLERTLAGVVGAATADQQLALIRSHPDLVGRAALSGSLGPASTAEQTAAGLDRDVLTGPEIAAFADLNQRYWQRFDFPFVICARENQKAAILAGFQRRLGHARDHELATALREIAKIAHYRLRDMIRDERDAGQER